MCLVFFSIGVNKNFQLIVAANRDEFYERPTQRAGFWREAPSILAGKDLKSGGTWLGIESTRGRIAFVTNYREPGFHEKEAPSRGKLVSEFLSGPDNPIDYLKKLEPKAAAYNGFNLVVGNSDEMAWFSNRAEKPVSLEPGVYGLSNHLLNTPWPKVADGKTLFTKITADEELDEERLFQLLSDTEVKPDDRLPDTGVGVEWERTLSPAFIRSPKYGTRLSTVLTVDTQQQVRFSERSFDPNGGVGETRTFAFTFSFARSPMAGMQQNENSSV